MKIKLTEKQEAIIIGSILGDGYLEFNGYRGTRLQIKQSEKSKSYVNWLHRELKAMCKNRPIQRRDTCSGISEQDSQKI